jgi:hypothetical protein
MTLKREKFLFLAGIQTPDGPDRKLGNIPNTLQRLHCLDQNTENLNVLTCVGSPIPEDAGIITLRNVVEHSPAITSAL